MALQKGDLTDTTSTDLYIFIFITYDTQDSWFQMNAYVTSHLNFNHNYFLGDDVAVLCLVCCTAPNWTKSVFIEQKLC